MRFSASSMAALSVCGSEEAGQSFVDEMDVAVMGTRTTEKAGASFERPLEVAIGVLAKNVDLNGLGFVERLEGHDGLHEERLGIFEV
jgi:hypothetical protein